MKTEQLIDSLVAAGTTHRASIRKGLAGALVAGVAISLVFFCIELGVRTDIRPALATWRFDLKVVTMLLSVVLAFRLCVDCARPDVPSGAWRRFLPAVALLVLAVAAELALVPEAMWARRLVGTNSMICLSMLPTLSLAPLAAALAVLRRGAPASPARAGAAAGLLAAVCGASLYAFHCFDDSPLFVATWYTLATLPIVLLGAVAGHRLLRW